MAKPFSSGLDYGYWLERHGFERIGGGLFSGVYAKPGSDRCIKVFQGRTWDGWPRYIEWAAKNGYMGTFAPMVYSFKQHNGDMMAGSFYVAVMERLVCTIRDIETEYYGSDTSEQRQYYKYARSQMGYWEQTTVVAPDLAKFCQGVNDIGRDDAHDGNFMVRKDGQLVLIDPISSQSKPTGTRIKAGKLLPKVTTQPEIVP